MDRSKERHQVRIDFNNTEKELMRQCEILTKTYPPNKETLRNFIEAAEKFDTAKLRMKEFYSAQLTSLKKR